ncbi:putative short-chain type dehydrogenase/reductase [Mycobacterium ulcerans str. Harvey]|uniref:Short-chain type dehydrogenase/reductase n=1 Tax=Mycobacterium ulcerans str. Harvey TaxID=1299332 RepID=A0ABN0QMB2_MYCUL|nr:putative short-chain type dehydrogenase/reductase [Mycobacterium ulcerans str. Harvey]
MLELDFVGSIVEPAFAYPFAKQANSIRSVRKPTMGQREARSTRSADIISTPMGQQELASPVGDGMRAMIAMSGTGRNRNPDDIAAAAPSCWAPRQHSSPGRSPVDGGVVAAIRANG